MNFSLESLVLLMVVLITFFAFFSAVILSFLKVSFFALVYLVYDVYNEWNKWISYKAGVAEGCIVTWCRSMLVRYSMSVLSETPPWQTRILLSMIVARGNQLKISRYNRISLVAWLYTTHAHTYMYSALARTHTHTHTHISVMRTQLNRTQFPFIYCNTLLRIRQNCAAALWWL